MGVHELIPCEFYQESWEDAEHPMACVSLDNKFLRVNHAFERHLGYSTVELEGRLWMDFTAQEHVGGDLASVQRVLEGTLPSYRMDKDYIHKRGHKVPSVLTVRRYPRNALDPILYFRIEAPTAAATRPELDEIEKHALQAVASVRDELNRLKQGVFVQNNNSNSAGGDITGRDKTINSDTMIKYLVLAVICMIFGMIWFMYYISQITTDSDNIQSPPTIVTPESLD